MTAGDVCNDLRWAHIKIGDSVFRNVKLCTRCNYTTVDPSTGITLSQPQGGPGQHSHSRGEAQRRRTSQDSEVLQIQPGRGGEEGVRHVPFLRGQSRGGDRREDKCGRQGLHIIQTGNIAGTWSDCFKYINRVWSDCWCRVRWLHELVGGFGYTVGMCNIDCRLGDF